MLSVCNPCDPFRYGNVKYVDERHRHRYEVNPEMVLELEAAGLQFVGRDETGQRMEASLSAQAWALLFSHSGPVS